MNDRMFDLMMQKNDEAVALRGQLAAMTAANNKAVKALKAQRPAGDYESDEEMELCIKLRRDVLAELEEVK